MRGKERETERGEKQNSENARGGGYKHGCRFAPFCKKGDRKERGRARGGEKGEECPTERVGRKGRVQCDGIEWSEKSNGVDLPRGVGEMRVRKRKEALYPDRVAVRAISN